VGGPEIGLDARAGAGVRPGNGERSRHMAHALVYCVAGAVFTGGAAHKKQFEMTLSSDYCIANYD
jgi:hypothetical protein